MTIFQMRHKILQRHQGEWFTPKQLRAEFLKEFPTANPASINAADCFNTAGKRAGCTCPECTKLGGFAVNSQGKVDMGASGFGDISATYIPTGNTRNGPYRPVGSVTPAAQAGMIGSDGILRINPNDAIQCIEEYNSSYYRGRSNTALDFEAYQLFRDGIARDRLVEQISIRWRRIRRCSRAVWKHPERSGVNCLQFSPTTR